MADSRTSGRLDRRLTYFRRWARTRGFSYLAHRVATVVRRYGLTSAPSKRKALTCIQLLRAYDAAPTLVVPGRVVANHPDFIRTLQERGAELAVHGYDHIDFHSLSAKEMASQFTRALDEFARAGIRPDGFRLPYLSFSPERGNLLPPERFLYSSNHAISFASFDDEPLKTESVFRALDGFYTPQRCEEHLALPRIEGSLVELPIVVPDDLELLDGIGFTPEQVAAEWVRILRVTHTRGELCTLMFHPESFDECSAGLEAVLRDARGRTPRVWVTQLREVAIWWREKAEFSTHVEERNGRRTVRFECSDRATVIAKDITNGGHLQPWYGRYERLRARQLTLAFDGYPFVGLAGDLDASVGESLREQGFIVVADDRAARCTISVDRPLVERLGNQVALVRHLDESEAPLVRFGAWPGGARSALCLTGDLDGLSLRDFAQRVTLL